MHAINPTTWRLLRHQPATGAWNMAVDEAISRSVQAGNSPPTLRLYAWDPACLSLGYAQSIRDVNLKRLADKGWDVVRRPTGGRAILHTDEMTYAVISPAEQPPVVGGVLESYQRLSGALVRALELLEVPITVEQGKSAAALPDGPNPVCFEVPSDYEITVDGKKLVGSAQARRRGVVLQHGSLPLYGDITRIVEVLHYEDEQQRAQSAARVQDKATTVESAIGRVPTWDEVAEAFINGFANALEIELIKGNLSKDELADSERWLEEKYANPDWTERS